jgi:Domain of unknown function (DUF4249)
MYKKIASANTNALILLSLAVLTFSCLDQIELKNQKFSSRVVILQGKLVQASGGVSVNVSLTSTGALTGTELEAHISGAKISLIDEKGRNWPLSENLRARIYSAKIPQNNVVFSLQTGQKYHIRAILNNGRVYESNPEPLMPVPKLEKVTYKYLIKNILDQKGFVTPDTFVRYSVYTNLKTSADAPKANLKWEFHVVYKLTDHQKQVCYNYEPQRVEQVHIYNASLLKQERLDEHALLDVFLEFKFAEGYHIRHVQESLSPGAYQYWEEVKALSLRNGNMFDPPPGTIASNIRNMNDPRERVFGYFYATTQDTLPMFIWPKEMGYPNLFCADPKSISNICQNCLKQHFSTLVKPKFWPE